MSDSDYWERYGVFDEDICEDVRSARRIGRRVYDGRAVVLASDDPLSVEWDLWDELYA